MIKGGADEEEEEEEGLSLLLTTALDGADPLLDREAEAGEEANLLELHLSFFFSPSTALFSDLCLTVATLRLTGRTHVHSKPILARRLTQRGMGFPVRRRQASSQKWLQFLVMRW